ncbi:hypothetical protein J7E87_32160 [Streptomyces sp. ISL-1]|uniref:hypothetical protein n=1 Tax=Streptomyces sp. ISL-1 TaxID=2817657 RepID=UPI001BE5A467|nr:hypothetical protein [Streptomyces sp. ISL-1]MBT2393941.1 hypothetical protein [Streptomyces sp. ISL-1]
MRLCTVHPLVPRTWTVELRPQHGGSALHCPRCAPQGQLLQGASARPAALAHLARHARSDVLPPHLRVCQCHERGCRWHPRHRGCGGPILLVLTREHGGRLWRLADVCAACAATTPHAAVVPDTTHTLSAEPASDKATVAGRPPRPHGPAEQARIQDMLSYLAAALPASAGPEARLLALQCALRATCRGRVLLPAGLLRGMRLHHVAAFWHQLEEHHWLHLARPNATGAAVIAQLIDPLNRAPGRAGRLRAADWALRATSSPRVRDLPVGTRLAWLALASHTSPAHPRTSADTDRVSRACGTDAARIGPLLDQLLAAGMISDWDHAPDTDELIWATSPPPAQAACPRSALDSRLSGDA